MTGSAAAIGPIVCFGEALMRLDAPGFQRFVQADSFQASFTGGESNVAVAAALWGLTSRMVSKVPAHDLGDACVNYYRRYGVDTRFMARGGDRLGIFFVENGRSQRGPRVIYDRSGSSFRQISPADFAWDQILDGASWFHFSGTAPALGEPVRNALRTALRECRERRIPVSFDCSYRSALWSVAEAAVAFQPLMEFVDVYLGSEQDARQFFGITTSGEQNQRDLRNLFGFRCVAYTTRDVTATGINHYSASILVGDELVTTPVFEIDVVDRIGAGDALTAGVIRGLLLQESPEVLTAFAMAAAVLKHSVPGDFALLGIDEIRQFAAGGSLAKVRR
ncbi:MAG: sugar kinase [Planctomycetaceae bacterium]|nr:sugar kinase [Planctomycetaceae bacterium]